MQKTESGEEGQLHTAALELKETAEIVRKMKVSAYQENLLDDLLRDILNLTGEDSIFRNP